MPLLCRKRRDHETLAVATAEIPAERAPDGVAEPLAVAAAVEHLRHRSAVGDSPDCDIAQWNAQLLALTRYVAVTDAGEQRESAVSAGDEVPGRQHLVHRRRIDGVPIGGACHLRIAAGGVDGEVH